LLVPTLSKSAGFVATVRQVTEALLPCVMKLARAFESG